MVCAQVIGNDMAVAVGGATGHLELNVFKPLIINNILQSTRLLADAAESFAIHMVDLLEPDFERIADHLARSPMLVTALAPHIGYDAAVRIAKAAMADNITLKDAAEKLALVTQADFERWVRTDEMVRPAAAPAVT